MACMDPRGTVGRIYKEDHNTLLHTKYKSFKPCGFREEDFFLCFSHCKSMEDNDPQGGAIFDPRSMAGRIYKEDHYILRHTKYESSGPCGFGEEDFFMFSHDAPGAGPVGTPGARMAGFIKKTTILCYIQNLKALGLVVSEKKIFLCFSHCKPMGANDSWGGAIFDPRGMVGRIYIEDHYTLLRIKYESSGPCGFGEEDFFMFFP